MNATTISNARNKLLKLITDVNMSSEPITIVNPKGQNAVLISENDWNAIMETNYLNSIPGMAESIIAGGAESIDNCKKYVEDEEW